MNSASDHGYTPGPLRCSACGSHETYCCDGEGRRPSFDLWASWVDREICRIEQTERNEVTYAYAEAYMRGLSVAAAVEEALA